MSLQRCLGLDDDVRWCVVAGPRLWDRDECARILAAASDPRAALTAAFGAWTEHVDALYYGHDKLVADELIEGLDGWNTFLSTVDHMFAAIDDAPNLEQGVHRALAELLALVVEATSCEDSWYGTAVVAMSWLQDHLGVRWLLPPDHIENLVEGRFESWVAPPEDVAAEVVGVLAESFATRSRQERPDALAAWRRDRTRLVDAPPRRDEPVTADAHLDYIRTIEHARDPERAIAMEVALDACRETASRALPLDLVALSAWQRAVLPGSTAELRRTDAFAKAGRERYAVTDDLATAFEAALSEAEDPSLPVLVRAARLYLDVCYFHPFADGNARAARLALDHFLTSRGLGLRGLHPILLPWRVDIDPLPVLTGILTTVVGPCPWIETTRRLT